MPIQSPATDQPCRKSYHLWPASAFLGFLLLQTRSIQSRFLQSRNLNCIALCEGRCLFLRSSAFISDVPLAHGLPLVALNLGVFLPPVLPCLKHSAPDT